MSQTGNTYKKLHKWPGIIISFVLFYYGATGIIMNHRGFFSRIDFNRNILPKEFQYHNWNNSAVKGNLIINGDSILVYGNIGIWATDSTFKHYASLNKGFPRGADNRKIFDVHRSADGQLYAATYFGLFAFNRQSNSWENFKLDVNIKRFVGIESIGDTIYALNRSYLFKGKSEGIHTTFQKIELKEPVGYRREVGLFETIWQIHSGEIFGLSGKLFVDLLGLTTILLSVTGIIYFFFPGWIRHRKRKKQATKKQVKINRWSLKWHNKIGTWLFAFLILLFFTGMFLRPPLLIAIAYSKIAPVKYSHLDQPNPWYDKLRDILYDEEKNILLLSTSDGMFYLNTKEFLPVPFKYQPPVSIMGINTFEPFKDGAFLIGSFSGLFLWHPSHPEIYDYALGKIHKGISTGKPVGNFKITGTLTDVSGKQYMIDYDKGVVPLWHSKEFPAMPQNVLKESKMSLWSFALELHTGRIFKSIIGNFYILMVPLSGLTGIIVVLSGYLLWRKRFRKKKN